MLGVLLGLLLVLPLAAAASSADAVSASLRSLVRCRRGRARLDPVPDPRRVDALGGLRVVLPTRYQNALRQFLLSPVDLRPVGDAGLSNLVWALVLGTLAAWLFQRKDVSG